MSNAVNTLAADIRALIKAHTTDDVRLSAYEKVVLELLAHSADVDAKRDAEDAKLQDIGKSTYDCIVDMVAALECDYDRLVNPDDAEELYELIKAAGDCTSREEAAQRINEGALSVEVRSGWYEPTANHLEQQSAEEFCILLGTGGPATRIIGELNEHGEPTRARLQVQNWGTPWTDYRGADSEVLLSYCRCFYFDEG